MATLLQKTVSSCQFFRNFNTTRILLVFFFKKLRNWPKPYLQRRYSRQPHPVACLMSKSDWKLEVNSLVHSVRQC